MEQAIRELLQTIKETDPKELAPETCYAWFNQLVEFELWIGDQLSQADTGFYEKIVYEIEDGASVSQAEVRAKATELFTLKKKYEIYRDILQDAKSIISFGLQISYAQTASGKDLSGSVPTVSDDRDPK